MTSLDVKKAVRQAPNCGTTQHSQSGKLCHATYRCSSILRVHFCLLACLCSLSVLLSDYSASGTKVEPDPSTALKGNRSIQSVTMTTLHARKGDSQALKPLIAAAVGSRLLSFNPLPDAASVRSKGSNPFSTNVLSFIAPDGLLLTEANSIAKLLGRCLPKSLIKAACHDGSLCMLLTQAESMSCLPSMRRP